MKTPLSVRWTNTREPRIVDAENRVVATVGTYRTHPAEDLANAKLLSAAPELLAALEAVHNWWTLTPAFQNGEDDIPAAVFDGMVNAITKAKGTK